MRAERYKGCGLFADAYRAEVCDSGGEPLSLRCAEEGLAAEVLRGPRHPYTQGLLAASPSLEKKKLLPIPGTVPQLTALPPGCAFEPRCGLRRGGVHRGCPGAA